MPESPRDFDLIVIGGGPAGLVGATTAAAFGKTVAIVDSHHELGGAGANTGTVPSKTLRETALAFSGMRSRNLFGVDLSLRREATVADFFRHYFNRHRVHVLKLAVIYEVSRSLSLRPSEATWKRAARAAKRLEETIFSLLGTGMNKEGFAIRQMEDRVRKAGADGLPLSELTRAFQHDNKPIRVQRLQTLLASETVLAFLRQTAGRAAIILVQLFRIAEVFTNAVHLGLM